MYTKMLIIISTMSCPCCTSQWCVTRYNLWRLSPPNRDNPIFTKTSHRVKVCPYRCVPSWETWAAPAVPASGVSPGSGCDDDLQQTGTTCLPRNHRRGSEITTRHNRGMKVDAGINEFTFSKKSCDRSWSRMGGGVLWLKAINIHNRKPSTTTTATRSPILLQLRSHEFSCHNHAQAIIQQWSRQCATI